MAHTIAAVVGEYYALADLLMNLIGFILIYDHSFLQSVLFKPL